MSSMRARPQSPFDFNLFSLSFPAMCLRCLSSPPALSFGASFSKQRSWSIDPPTFFHFEALRRWLDAKLRDWRIRRKALGIVRAPEQANVNGHERHTPSWSIVDPDADEHEEICTRHLHEAYQAWQELSEPQKHERWHAECVTALTQEQDRHRETRDRMERIEREVQNLQAELNERNRPQAPSTIPLSQQTACQTFDSTADLEGWDYDKLISKWRTRIENERVQQYALPAPPTPKTVPSPDSVRSPLYSNGTEACHQQHQHQQQQQETTASHMKYGLEGMGEDEDLVDAPGEADDTEPLELMEPSLLDPKIREKKGLESIDTAMGNDVDGE